MKERADIIVDKNGRRKISRGLSKIRNSFGVFDCYRLIRKNHWFDIGRPIKEKQFYAIIRGVNKLLAQNIAMGETVVFPESMGKLELRKFEVGASFKNGKLKVTYKVNWAETWKLWLQDAEEYKKGTVIRFEKPLLYSIKYCKDDATYENKIFYQFAVNRFIISALKENIQKGKADTLW